ncbi:MAG TPA: efflux RND transporter periplasmic adaptor subunit [Fimbriimonadaceae bacterium]|nr:efflux RND transporter periplasmic adaptor subunit [Fimbriimonadaceae bacterium]
MNRKALYVGIPIVLAAAGAFFFLRKSEPEPEVEYRYQTAAPGELVRSISATGQLVAHTKVEVKSKAGGRIVQLAVDEGTRVRRGQVIARIDPSDTRAVFDQAAADVRQAQARAVQAQENYKLQVDSSRTSVADAQAAVEAARVRYERSRIEYERQPALARATIETAQANLNAAQQSLQRFETVTAVQTRRDTELNLTRSRAALETAQADLTRQNELLQNGYVAQSAVDRARAAFESARAEFENAKTRSATVEQQLRTELETERAGLERARAALNQARTSQSDVTISNKQVQEARTALRQAEINLQRARDNVRNNNVRRTDVDAAKAGAVRSSVSLKNAREQLESTTVVAPRDGVVTAKFLEEGTIIPPGTSTFAQGTSIVEISDTTRMYVECAVDEADISDVRVGQKVRIRTEAYPGQVLTGRVERVNPAAQTEQNITAIRVRVEVNRTKEVDLRPGMNATCEFITLSKPDVLIVPAQALERDGGKTYVKVKPTDPKLPPRRVEIEVGETGNEGVEILSGLQPGQEVVVAEINLKELRETQQKMMEAQQGGGLAGGPMGGRRPGGSRPGGGGGAGGGARGGGGGGR